MTTKHEAISEARNWKIEFKSKYLLHERYLIDFQVLYMIFPNSRLIGWNQPGTSPGIQPH